MSKADRGADSCFGNSGVSSAWTRDETVSVARCNFHLLTKDKNTIIFLLVNLEPKELCVSGVS